MNSDPQRNQAGTSWVAKATVFSAVATVAAVTTGALLGFLGGLIPNDVRVGGATLLALAAVAIGVLELRSKGVRLPQVNHETPRSWIHAGGLRWAARNGWALGIGAMSRIGFWLWYVVPISALLSGHPLLGATLYGTYGFVRAGSAWLRFFGPLRRMSTDTVDLWLLHHYQAARKLAAGLLLLVGVTTAIVVGL